jgi:hypothetical protein
MTTESPRPQEPCEETHPPAGPEGLGEKHLGILLKEYESIAGALARLDALVWASTALVVVLTAAGAAYLLVNLPPDIWGLLVIGGAAALALGVLVCCWCAQERWRELISLHRYRGQEIEAALGMRTGRYVDLMDATAEQRSQPFPPTHSEAPSFSALGQHVSGRSFHPHLGSRARIVVLILCVVTWVSAVLVQIASALIYD